MLGTDAHQASNPHVAVEWALALPWTAPKQWWSLRQVSGRVSAAIGTAAIAEALRSWPLDPEHIHGGLSGKLLVEAVQLMISRGGTHALRAMCSELRRREVPSIPWLLRSKELLKYAAGHSETPVCLELLLSLAPHGTSAVVCRHRGFTLLHEAAFCGKLLNVELLLKARCDARAQSVSGENALHVACHSHSRPSVDIAEALLAHDASLATVMDTSGLLPSGRVIHAQRRWSRAMKREFTLEERHESVRLARLFESLPDTSAQEESVAVVRCQCCGLRTLSRRTPDGARSFCAICGVLR